MTQCTAGQQCWPGQAGLQVSPQSWEGCEGHGALWLDLPVLGTQGGRLTSLTLVVCKGHLGHLRLVFGLGLAVVRQTGRA